MGSFLAKLFVDPAAYVLPESLNVSEYNCTSDTIPGDICDVEGRLTDDGFGVFQLLLLMAVYGYALFYAAGLIGDGSELLLLVPNLKGVVGTLVLPILGAVPDGAIVLFSGMGANAQSQLSVGVGALAGSTIMLLTLTWGLTIVAGKVDITTDANGVKNCMGAYKRKSKLKVTAGAEMGVQPSPSVKTSCYIMLATSISYIVIQAPAMSSIKINADNPALVIAHEKTFAWIGVFTTGGMFLATCVYQYVNRETNDVVDRKLDRQRMLGINNKLITFQGAFKEEVGRLRTISMQGNAQQTRSSPSDQLLRTESSDVSTITKQLKAFATNHVWRKVDTDGDGEVSHAELMRLFDLLGEKLSLADLNWLSEEYDEDKDGHITKNEFLTMFIDWALGDLQHKLDAQHQKHTRVTSAEDGEVDDEDDDDEEEDEMPEEFLDMNEEEQQAAIKKRAFSMMGGGLVLVLLFSDPMVDCMTALGERIGISSFYISFVLAPLASNASELLAGYQYALKKTSTTITVAQSQLLGAGIMNNTFCLLVFMLLIALKPIKWAYSAETIAILIVEFLVSFVALKRIQTMFDAYLVFALYPASLLLVIVLENVVGLD